ncbi:hypothetical protein AB0C88_37530 [Streptomyces chartreusis]|uniref:hypothetical protein n=1 Tax=Streptomyces chartreusis TaxID=1969 RepID=UPI0033F5ADBA
MVEFYPEPLAGQTLRASTLRDMLPKTARKTADTPRSATTTATADTHLTFEVEANAVYTWWGWLKYDAPAAGDINIDFTVPSGALGEWTATGVGIGRVVGATDAATPVVQADTQASTGYMVRVETTDVAAARAFGGLGTAGTPLSVDLKGTLRMGSTAGTFSLDWAQRVSDATATTVYTDSWITMLRIA